MLTPEDNKILVELLNKIEYPHIGVSAEVFKELVKVVPYLACELGIINSQKEVLLTWREDEYWKGWHLPGGLLRFRESFEERIQAVAADELGIHVETSRLIHVSNNIDNPRGHTVSLVFVCLTPDKPKTGEWFLEAPKDIIQHHKDFFDNVKNFREPEKG